MTHFRIAFVLVLASLVIATAFAADPPKAGDTPKVDTSRGDKMIADYFAAETKKIADRCLADIKTAEDWKGKREGYRKQLFEMLSLDPLPAKTELKGTTTKTVEEEEFTVENVHFQSSPGLYVTGNLYIPKAKKTGDAKAQATGDAKGEAPASSPYPTILYVCGHGGVKKNNISYGNKTYYTHHGSWFARHGYVCLMIDSLQLGEIEGIHHGTYKYGMWWWLNRGYTPAGVEAWNCIRALDYLETRKEVDKDRIGVTGRSGGGAYSWWIAALDDRIKVAVPGAGITDLENHVVTGCVEGHCDCMYMHNTYRWDYAQVAALVAPRPLLISNTDKDTIFPLDGVVRLHGKVAHIYKLLGAEQNLGLNIVEGPHKDSQELQLGSFVWFDRFLRKEQKERTIDKPAVKMMEVEQLRVFEKLPEDQVNTKVQETFGREGPPKPLVRDATKEREMLMKALREQVFAGWPNEEETRQLAEQIRPDLSYAYDNVRLNVTVIPSHDTVDLTLFVVSRDQPNPKPALVELHVLDDYAWRQWLQAMKEPFGDALKAEMKVDADKRMYKEIAARVAKGDVALAFVCPRGVGPLAWDQSEKKQVQHRRRFMLLGQTLDGMQVWDIRRAIAAIRASSWGKDVQIHLRGERVMAGNVLYASLFETGIKQIELKHLKPTHREGPIYMNISKYMDIPQAVVMAATRCPVKLDMALAGDWSYLDEAKKLLDWNEKQLSITISPPPTSPVPK